ncbi:hypothetical protein [uncultured Sphingomonas sp.]|uniref:hypothetical protein n=1 Tax=uncultured Sphingomonas sp. TaxID=158754 RepID=UPI0025D38374|nr:hypothetical protein [uncultured Sphingomonas sp.]
MWIAVALIQAAVPVASVDDDLRCTAILSQQLEAAGEGERGPITAAMMYFVGRIQGAAPMTDIPEAVDKLRKTPSTKAQTDAIRTGCATRLLQQARTFAAIDPAALRVETVE